MFSKELENLIQATLEDGVLEPYELEALQKRAKAEGVDLTELEIYINSLLQKRNRELKEKEAAAQQQADEKRKAEMQVQVKEAKEKETANLKALGYMECPKCHKQVSPMTLVCECGFEFIGSKSIKSGQNLYEALNSIQLTKSEENEVKRAYNETSTREKIIMDKKISIISSFPVPNTKEDIIEFLALAAPNSKKKGGIWGTLNGRLVILCSLVLVIATIFVLTLSDTYVQTQAHLFEPNEQVTEEMPKGLIWILLVVGGIFASYFASKNIDTATLQWNAMATVWRAKFDQVLMKGRSLRGDAEFSQQLDYYENLINKK